MTDPIESPEAFAERLLDAAGSVRAVDLDAALPLIRARDAAVRREAIERVAQAPPPADAERREQASDFRQVLGFLHVAEKDRLYVEPGRDRYPAHLTLPNGSKLPLSAHEAASAVVTPHGNAGRSRVVVRFALELQVEGTPEAVRSSLLAALAREIERLEAGK